jgi:hypothetical protein
MTDRKWYDASRFADIPKHWNACVLACAVCMGVYLVNISFFEFQPKNNWGYVYGWSAGILMIAVAALGARRRTMKLAAKRNLRSARMWTQFHLYAGTVCMLLVLMHTGFRIPTGALNFWLWLLSIWVTISGFIGVLFQKTIPRMLASGLNTEVVFERIPDLVRQSREKAETVLAECGAPVRAFYAKNLAGSLIAPETHWRYWLDITGGIQSRVRQFSYLRNVLAGEEQERLDRLETIFRTKLEIDAHFTLQRALRWWLALHLPASLVLLLLLAIHIIAVYLY